jgi:hypothetical protein
MYRTVAGGADVVVRGRMLLVATRCVVALVCALVVVAGAAVVGGNDDDSVEVGLALGVSLGVGVGVGDSVAMGVAVGMAAATQHWAVLHVMPGTHFAMFEMSRPSGHAIEARVHGSKPRQTPAGSVKRAVLHLFVVSSA